MSTESDLKATVLSLLDDELNSDAELEIVHQNAEFSSSSKDEKLSSSTKKQQLTDTILRLMIDAIEQKLGKQEEKQETKKKAEGENKELEKEEWKSKEEEMKKKQKKTKDEEMKKEWKRKEEEWKQKTGAEEEEKKKREDEEGMKLSFKDDDVSEDVWTLEERVIYRWKDWKLIRTGSKTSKTDYLFIWSDAVVLRFNKNGGELFAFLMNGRLAWAANNYSWGLDSEQRQSEQKQPDYYYNDNAFSKTEFIGQLFRAKTEASKVGETMPILSVPRVFWQTIQFGEWLLSSGKAGTLLITHRRGTQLTIKAEDLRGFLFETKEHQKYLLRADPDWVLDI